MDEGVEIVAHNITTFDQGVLGCLKYKRQVMISITEENKKGFNDIFLNQEQALKLIDSLKRTLLVNWKGDAREIFSKLIQEDEDVKTALAELQNEEANSSMVAFSNGLIIGRVQKEFQELGLEIPVRSLMDIVNELIIEKGGRIHDYTGDKI